MKFPDTVDHYRRVTSFNSDGQELAAAPTAVDTGVKAWIVRPSSAVSPTPFGQVEIAGDTILLEAYDATGTLRVVRKGDWFIDGLTDDRWNAAGPGNPIRLPSSFAGTPRYSHIEVRVERADLEAAGVHPSGIERP